jgi:hypothetical protein
MIALSISAYSKHSSKCLIVNIMRWRHLEVSLQRAGIWVRYTSPTRITASQPSSQAQTEQIENSEWGVEKGLREAKRKSEGRERRERKSRREALVIGGYTFTFSVQSKQRIRQCRTIRHAHLYLHLLFRLSCTISELDEHVASLPSGKKSRLTGSSAAGASTPSLSSNFRFSAPISPSPFVDSAVAAVDAFLNRSSRALRLRSSSICSAVFSTGLIGVSQTKRKERTCSATCAGSIWFGQRLRDRRLTQQVEEWSRSWWSRPSRQP